MRWKLQGRLRVLSHGFHVATYSPLSSFIIDTPTMPQRRTNFRLQFNRAERDDNMQN